MMDHAALLKQIRADARPYVEQALDLAEVFTGFRKLASENGLDWGVIKQLIKAELQDEKEGGSEKVSRIIEKADFASAYADMLGLGSKMNEEKIISDPEAKASKVETGTAGLTEAVRRSTTGTGLQVGLLAGGRQTFSPAEENAGHLISDVPANGPATALAPGAEGETLKGDAGEQPAPNAAGLQDASPINSEMPPSGRSFAHKEDGKSLDDRTFEDAALVTAGETAPFPDMPDFLKRSAA